MRRRSRTRRVLKWVGLVGCVVILSIWFVSTHWTLGYIGPAYVYGFGDGFVAVGWYGGMSNLPEHWVAERVAGRFSVWPSMFRFVGGGPAFTIPFWLLFVPVAIPTAILWYRDRKPPPGCCPSCGYDLTGNVGGECPECGDPIRGDGRGQRESSNQPN